MSIASIVLDVIGHTISITISSVTSSICEKYFIDIITKMDCGDLPIELPVLSPV